jgi:DNA (cytosine-5)-methyltransferase 1
VFVVANLTDWRRAAAVLFESESLCRDITPRRSEGQKATGTLTRGFGDRGYDLDQIAGGGYKIEQYSKTAQCLTTKKRDDAESETFAIAENTIGRQPLNGGNGTGYTENGLMYTLNATGVHGIAQFVDTYNGTIQGDIAATMTADMAGPTHSGPKVMQQTRVRRLTPMECERLQGFPDNYTNIPNASDGPRYRALGNSMAVPVMNWIGTRIQLVEQYK